MAFRGFEFYTKLNVEFASWFTTRQDFVVRRVATYTFPKSGEKEIGAAQKTEEVTVTVRLKGSLGIVNGYPVLASLRGGNPTVARDGTLIVLIEKIDGN